MRGPLRDDSLPLTISGACVLKPSAIGTETARLAVEKPVHLAFPFDASVLLSDSKGIEMAAQTIEILPISPSYLKRLCASTIDHRDRNCLACH